MTDTDQTSDEKVRIGIVNYLNTAPILEKWKQSVHCKTWELVEENPVELNKKILEGEIDVGFVSSFEYGNHPEKYKILSGLSISANGPVGSVFLFSHVPLEQLDKSTVLLTAQSETSVQLLKIILEEFNEVNPDYTSGNVMEVEDKAYKAVLAIGDEALRLVEKSTYLYQYDLGDIWKRETGLPFVFAVCAVREEFFQNHCETIRNIHNELLRCRDEGVDDLETVCDIAAGRIPLSKQKCHDYLKAIEYDLAAPKKKALETFFEILIKRGDMQDNAIPLKIAAQFNDYRNGG